MESAPTLVHPIETSVSEPDYLPYRTIRLSSFPDEYPATKEMYSYLDNDQGKRRLEQLEKCRRYAWFVRDTESGSVHVQSNACRLRWCPICSQTKTAFITSEVEDWILRTKFVRFLTLTLKHTNAPLDHQIDFLYKHFRKLRVQKQFAKLCKGGIWFFQIKRSKDGTQWHPHLHCLLKGSWIERVWLSNLWLKITGTSNVIDIRAVNNPAKVASDIARYCSRPAMLKDYPLSQRVEIFNALHGRRLCGKWGSVKGVSFSPPKTVDTGRYKNIGNWSTVNMLVDSEPMAKQIIEAWKTGDTIAEDVSCLSYDIAIDNPIELHIEELDKDIQTYFEPFR